MGTFWPDADRMVSGDPPLEFVATVSSQSQWTGADHFFVDQCQSQHVVMSHLQGRALRLIIRTAFTANINTQQKVAACVVTSGTLELRMIQQ